eukprot:m.149990 g.149990  ORF g.149990 m.149990 type:complete len:153 (+) comp13276_c0_seq5:95-553(+)
MIGCLQALEVIKLVTATTPSEKSGVMANRFLMWDGEQGMFRVIKMRKKQEKCVSCGDVSNKMTTLMDNYEAFCHMDACDATRGVDILRPIQRITATDLASTLIQSKATDTIHVSQNTLRTTQTLYLVVVVVVCVCVHLTHQTMCFSFFFLCV